MGKQQAEQADSRALRMEEISLRIEDLTEDMHLFAWETREETISMRIMAFVALLFLPGTFASVDINCSFSYSSPRADYNADRH